MSMAALGLGRTLSCCLQNSVASGKHQVMNQATARDAASGIPFPTTPQIIFANWREALHNAGLSAAIQTVYCMAVQGYLDYCAQNAISVRVESARAYMDDVTRRGLAREPELWKEGLNW